MKTEEIIKEAQKLKPGSKGQVPTLIHVLIEIEATIRHLSTLYANPEITSEKKAEFERIIKEADTRAMAILTIIRNKP